MPISDRFTSKLVKHWEVYFSQCYPNATIKLPELANLLQLTAAEHANLGGLGFYDLQQSHQTWVMNRMRIEIEKLPSWSDEIAIQTWIESLEGVKSIRNFELSVSGEHYLGVSTLWAVFNMQTRRPEPLVLDTAHFDFYPNEHATVIPNQRLDINFDASEYYDYTVQFSDLDIVNHVNNTKYLEWCLNYIDPAYIHDQQIVGLDLNFMRELSLYDRIRIAKARIGNKILFRILKEQHVHFVAAITLKEV